MQKSSNASGWSLPFGGLGAGRERKRLPGVDRILVPVRGAPIDQDALLLSSEIARQSKAMLYVVYIIEVPRTLPLHASPDSEMDAAETVLSQMESTCERQHVKVETELLQARQTGPAVVAEATERGADLIVMGMSYKRRYGDFTLGDAIPYILEYAMCPVWVLREPMSREGSEK